VDLKKGRKKALSKKAEIKIFIVILYLKRRKEEESLKWKKEFLVLCTGKYCM